ncbi:hypothetical protein [Glutamicibacter sp.]|uniref:hypothetical protein n=1 Tax=Glutamicibacter sp. TaxID=1931995 RepID=UPI0028BEA27F|nr:hypothetical protein [Glutamicibacter sp.]
MSTEIEARRLNGTDLGKSLGRMGDIQSVTHSVETFEQRAIGSKKSVVVELKIVEVVTHKGSFGFRPSDKITITGKPSPKSDSSSSLSDSHSGGNSL